MATKEHLTHEMDTCVCDCRSYRVKPAIFRLVQQLSLQYFSVLLSENI